MMQDWRCTAMLPWQLLPAMVVLLPKPDAGERPICLENMLVRIYLRTFKSYGQEWSEAQHGFWDDAVRGSSALRAGLLRALLDESALLLVFVWPLPCGT